MIVSFKPSIMKDAQRKDGTYGVMIRIGFKSKYVYAPTSYSVSKTELKKSGEIKNTYIMDRCNELVAEYRSLIAFAGDLSNFDVKMVYDFIETKKGHQEGLDYSKLFRTYLKENKSSPSIALYQATYNHLVRFKGDKIMVNDITPDFLMKLEGHLRETVAVKGRAMGSRGINLYLSKVRAVYNWIMDEYIYKGYTFMYPFRKYKIPKAKYPRTVSLTKEQLRAIIETPLKGIESNRVRDAFVISLLTLGTNAKDLYELKSIGKRMEYNRSKTKEKREDSAFISIKVEPELEPYLKKHKGKDRAFSFASTHVSSHRFNNVYPKRT